MKERRVGIPALYNVYLMTTQLIEYSPLLFPGVILLIILLGIHFFHSELEQEIFINFTTQVQWKRGIVLGCASLGHIPEFETLAIMVGLDPEFKTLTNIVGLDQEFKILANMVGLDLLSEA